MKEKNFFTKRMLLNMVVVAAGISFYFALLNFHAISTVILRFFYVLSPFTAGFAIAYLLNMPMRIFEQKIFKRFRKKRLFAILTVYILAIFIVALLLGMIAPQLITSIYTLIGNIPLYFNNINSLLGRVGDALDLEQETMTAVLVSYRDIVNQIVTLIRGVSPELLSMTMRIGTGLVSVLTTIIASIYLLFAKDKLLLHCRGVLYAIFSKRHADTLVRIGHLSNDVFSGFISGKIIDSAIIGVLCFIFMSLMNLSPIKMPYALLISVIIGVTNIIPFYGPFIGAIPSVLILLMVEPWSALWFLIFIIVLQQFDGNYLGPKILGNSTGLPAIWVLLAIVVGGGLFGFTGMLLGVPTAAVLYALACEFIKNRLRKKGITNLATLEYLPTDPAMDSAPEPEAGEGGLPGDEGPAT